jgi:hypothetical protein
VIAGALLLLGGGLARAQARVAVVGLVFEGEVSKGVREEMSARLGQGLTAAGWGLAPEAELARARGGHEGPCVEAACWKRVATALGCRYAVGGLVKGDARNYDIALWIGDSLTGTVVARVEERCDICGLHAAAEKMDLTASALAARLAAAERAPAHLAVVADPAGATVLVDGKEIGPAPRELELAPGKHHIVVRSKGYVAAERSLLMVAGAQERLGLRLLQLPGTSPARVVGWVSLGAGLAALGAGIALIAIDGQAVDCPATGEPKLGLCHYRASLVEGAVLTGLGAAALGAGGYLLYRTRAVGKSELRTTVAPAGAGARVAVTF